jgi:hypothetical protein
MKALLLVAAIVLFVVFAALTHDKPSSRVGKSGKKHPNDV